MYQSICSQNQLNYLNDNADILLISGWSNTKLIIKTLEDLKVDQEIHTVSNLFSPVRGIDLLLRNLLANPSYYKLLVLDLTKEDKSSGSVLCLKDFFDNGFIVSEDTYSISSRVEGFISSDLPTNLLNKIRKDVVIEYCQLVDNIPNCINRLKQVNKKITREPVRIPPKLIVSKPIEGFFTNHRIETDNINSAWVSILQRIRKFGILRKTGWGGYWQEILGMQVTIKNTDSAWILEDYLPIDQKSLEAYYPSVLTSERQLGDKSRGKVKYTYGDRIFTYFGVNQIDQVVNKLINEIDAASAVISLWDTSDHEYGGSPCLNHIWFRVTDKMLHCFATFRSNDMFSAWCSNVSALRELQKIVLTRLNESQLVDKIGLGYITTNSLSAHIYEDCFGYADKLESEYQKTLNKNRLKGVGNFIITINDDKDICVEFQQKSIPKRIFCDKNPLKLIRKIAASFPNINPDHIGYLGIECERAFRAIKENKQYNQDNVK